MVIIIIGGREMTREEYHQYLKSDEWREIRAKVLKRNNGLCCYCNRKPSKIVHHIIYDVYNLGKEDEHSANLMPVCSSCHAYLHNGFYIKKKQAPTK